LKIPKGCSEAANRGRTDSTMAKTEDQKYEQ